MSTAGSTSKQHNGHVIFPFACTTDPAFRTILAFLATAPLPLKRLWYINHLPSASVMLPLTMRLSELIDIPIPLFPTIARYGVLTERTLCKGLACFTHTRTACCASLAHFALSHSRMHAAGQQVLLTSEER
jgi:hypothetical protein